jgi:hypothetical protein
LYFPFKKHIERPFISGSLAPSTAFTKQRFMRVNTPRESGPGMVIHLITIPSPFTVFT